MVKYYRMHTGITADKLKDNPEFKLVRILSHDEVVEFVISQIKQLRWPMLSFYLLLTALLTKIIAFSLHNVVIRSVSWPDYWLFLVMGTVAGMIIVIPFHELVHGLAYRLAGAKKIKYGADIRQMLFYASAPGFVAGKTTFYFVAFSPFIIINAIFVTGILLGSPDWKWASLVALTVHSSMCIGDFAMVNFFARFPGKEVLTFDEDNTRKSYFYIKTPSNS